MTNTYDGIGHVTGHTRTQSGHIQTYSLGEAGGWPWTEMPSFLNYVCILTHVISSPLTWYLIWPCFSPERSTISSTISVSLSCSGTACMQTYSWC